MAQIDRRMAQKRGSGKRASSLDEAWMTASAAVSPGADYEAAVFRAKVTAAIRAVEKECDFQDFAIFQMRVLDGRSGKDVANDLGTSEPTVSRRLAKVRTALRSRLTEIISTYSFTQEELSEPSRNGLVLDPNKPDDALFDEAIAEIYHTDAQQRRAGLSATD